LLDNGVRAVTTNISALTFEMPVGRSPFERPPLIEIDGERLTGRSPASDRSWRTHLRKANGRWTIASSPAAPELAKRSGLQGPIDDAFMDSFVMVLPSGTALNEQVAKWVAREAEHAIDHWRKQVRGEALVLEDSEVTEEQIKRSNLVLWGDPQSNAILGKIAERLPITWNKREIKLAAKTYSAENHVPALIFPNPLNPERYVVINSGFTFREYDYLNNARQVAKLPDYAVLDISVPPNSRYAGKVIHAGFFDEKWSVKE
jgi:hypothetical protein